MSDTKILITRLFSEVKKLGIDVCVLRNYDTLPDTVPGSDIDILVPPESATTFLEILSATSTAQGWVLDSRYLKNHRICHLRFYKSPPEILETTFIRFDVMTAIGGGACCFFDAATVFKTAQHKDLFCIPARGMENSINLLLAAFYRVPLKLRYGEAIQQGPLVEIEACLNILDDPTLRNDLVKLGDEGQNNSPSAHYRKRLKRWAFRISPASYCLEFFYSLGVYGTRIFRPPGRLIVVLGPDGVGKSTAMASLVTRLTPLYADIATGHLRPRILPELSEFFGRNLKEERKIGHSSDNGVTEKAGFLSSLIRMSYYALDFSIGYFLKIYPKLIKGEAVIFDRYFYDYYVDHTQKMIWLPKKILRVICALFPKPDSVFFLYATADVILSRRDDLSAAEIERQNNGFLALKKIYPAICVIDAERSVVEITEHIVADHVRNSRR